MTLDVIKQAINDLPDTDRQALAAWLDKNAIGDHDSQVAKDSGVDAQANRSHSTRRPTPETEHRRGSERPTRFPPLYRLPGEAFSQTLLRERGER